MITLKFPYKSNYDFTKIRQQFSIIVRFSFNRFQEGKSEKDIRTLCKSLNNIYLLDSWLIQCAIREGKQLFSKFETKKIVFGGKKNFSNYIKNKIIKEDFKNKRILGLTVQGEKLQKGNRKFKLNIENKEIVFKLNKKEHYKIELPNIRKNLLNKLLKVQKLNDLDGYTYCVRISEKFIFISFEDFKKETIIKRNENCYLGIDMNPDNIGVSIFKDDKIIHTNQFDLSKITNEFINSSFSSKCKKSKYFHNKIKFETFEISKKIENLCNEYHCKYLFIEKLSFKNHGIKKSTISNRKNNNLWKRNVFVNNIKKRCEINGIKLFEMNPAYSSFIGNMMNDYSDSINASIEIGRRGYDMIIKRNKQFYPKFEKQSLKHRWKEMVEDENSWVELFKKIKNSKLKYRVSLNECKKEFRVFRLNSKKSRVINYEFNL